MRVVVYDETGEMALDYDTRSDALSLCPGRLVFEPYCAAILRVGLLTDLPSARRAIRAIKCQKKLRQRADNRALMGELSFAGVAYRIS